MLIIVRTNPSIIFFLMFRNLPCMSFLLFLLTACSSTAKIDHVDTKVYSPGTPGMSMVDSGIYNSFLPYKKELDTKMDVVLAYSEQVMEKGQPEGVLGNFVADLSLEETNKTYYPADGKKADFCFLNNGGLRATLPKGELTKRKIFEVMPFENELIVLTLDGNTTGRLLDFIANKGGMPVAGIRFKIQHKKAVEVFIGNEMYDSTRSYKVVTSDYLANGGDNLSFLAEVKQKEAVGLKLRDAMVMYLEEQQKLNHTIRVQTDNRISNAK